MQIQTADIADGAMTAAKLANLAAGKVLGNNGVSSGVPAAISAWIEIIAETTVSSQANFVIDLSTFYNVYKRIRVEIYELVVPATADLQMTGSSDGTNYVSTGYLWAINGGFSNGSSNTAASASSTSASNTSNWVIGNSIGNGSGHNNIFELNFYDMGNSSFNPTFRGEACYSTATPSIGNRLIGGEISTAEILQKLKFVISTASNFSCKWRVEAKL